MMYLFLFICFIIYLVVPNESLSLLGTTYDSLWHCFSYPFAHASFIHWLVNAIALGTMWEPICNIYIRKFYATSQSSPALIKVKLFFEVYMGAVIASLFTVKDIPTIGASGMVFFLLGMLIILNPTKRQLISFIPVAIAIVMQIFFSNSNIFLHILAFIFGVLFIIIKSIWVQKNI